MGPLTSFSRRLSTTMVQPPSPRYARQNWLSSFHTTSRSFRLSAHASTRTCSQPQCIHQPAMPPVRNTCRTSSVKCADLRGGVMLLAELLLLFDG